MDEVVEKEVHLYYEDKFVCAVKINVPKNVLDDTCELFFWLPKHVDTERLLTEHGYTNLDPHNFQCGIGEEPQGNTLKLLVNGRVSCANLLDKRAAKRRARIQKSVSRLNENNVVEKQVQLYYEGKFVCSVKVDIPKDVLNATVALLSWLPKHVDAADLLVEHGHANIDPPNFQYGIGFEFSTTHSTSTVKLLVNGSQYELVE